jgi:hypothetical protein
LPSFAGARAKLATATQDLFRLSGNHALPVEAPAVPEPPKPSSPGEPMSSTRKPEASMMFSLEALMKATQHTPKPEAADEASDQLWSMQAATPLFGTAHDQALLTTPLKMEPAQSMDSMTLPSQTPNGRRWWPIVLAAGAGLALAGGGIWLFGISNGTSPVSAATPPSEAAALVAEPLAEPPSVVEPALAEPTKLASQSEAAPSPTEPTPAEPGATPPASDADPGATTRLAAVESSAVASGAVPSTGVSSSSVSSNKADAEKNKAVRDKPLKKPAPRVEKPSAPLKLAAVFAFDKAAAKTALNSAAQASSSCGAGGEPGKGKIQVTFAPTGKVSDAQLVEGPFVGTTAGKCAVRLFKAAKVPAFSGAPVTVAKSFKID